MKGQVLKGKIVEKGMNVESVASAIGISKDTMYRKINNLDSFTIREARGIANFLQLSDDDAFYIFLS